MSALAVRGVVEGFYGRPYTWEDRHRMVQFLGGCGANTYVYAPKNDPLHRDRWQEPYLAEEWRRFAELAEAGAQVGVDVWFGLSPLGLRLTEDDDVAALRAKLAAADDAGLHRICLLVDDMPEDFASSGDAERFSTLAAAHVHLVDLVRSFLRERGPDRRLWFVPLHYHGDPDDAYVREIGAGIDRDVPIMWTGPEVCSQFLTLEHTRQVAASLRRPVLYWDNHPVNDGEMRHDPHLNALTGRDPRLGGTETLGLLANVAIQPEASLIAVATAMAYATDPAGYEADRAWWAALHEVTGDERDARDVAALADLARRTPLRRGDYRLDNRLAEPLRRCITGFEAAAGDRRKPLDEVGALLGELAETADHLASGLRNVRLRRDLAPWSAKLVHQSRAARLALEVLRRAVDTGAGDAPGTVEVLDALERARASFHWVAGDQLEVFARWCLRQAEAMAS
ncbi:beta-N-acetylglucosaminidase domain-containing protein [Egicoccus sp. AB-alg6-2]|uniref:beta-N-acetylglucosaminidase domain-containing protein n=1 Tax=Egicoccus sp. AB-alg6-2 TaxID=3242692 RepID=UPI00359D096D